MTADAGGTRYGRQQFWDDSYAETNQFSWYCGWSELDPFWRELVPNLQSRVLLPGVGNDEAMVDMFDAGWERLSAFDYAPQGVARAEELFADRRLDDLRVADAKELPYPDNAFDAALEKGALDAIYLSGGADPQTRQRELQLAVDELERCIKPGGIVLR